MYMVDMVDMVDSGFIWYHPNYSNNLINNGGVLPGRVLHYHSGKLHRKKNYFAGDHLWPHPTGGAGLLYVHGGGGLPSGFANSALEQPGASWNRVDRILMVVCDEKIGRSTEKCF